NDGKTHNPSVIKNTFETFVIVMNGESSTDHLNGGMIGAVLIALFYYLFDVTGAKFIAFIMIVIGITLITGKSFGEAFGKVISFCLNFIKNQWSAFMNDMKEWMNSRKVKREERKSQKQQQRENKRNEEPEREEEEASET